MKVCRIKRIMAGSIFKFSMCVVFVATLIACVVLLIMGYSLKDVGIELNTFQGTLGVGAGVLGAVLASVVCGIGAGIVGAVMALLYNLFAAAVGGVAVKTDSE